MDINKLFFPLCIFLLCSCGGTGEDEASPKEGVDNQIEVIPDVVEPEAFGQLLDAKVSGLRYSSGDHTGVTDENGQFGYLIGVPVQFFVGDISIGTPIEAKPTLTPYDLAEQNSFVALNIARFLQSLDNDDDLSNGIQIHSTSHTLAKNTQVDFSSGEWELTGEDNSSIDRLVSDLTSQTLKGSRETVSNWDAYTHFAETLDAIADNLEEQIVQKLDMAGCSTNSDCKIYSIQHKSENVSYCPIEPVSYPYFATEAELDDLSNEREAVLDVKGDLYNDISIPISGFCTTYSAPIFSVCNAQNRCELTTLIPIEE